ncbi:MAG: hypothetical protein IT495_12250 [Gammaproteobacteria bacterium]|nr:hypothetical protein [Gammaproteobacteria bacterium]
MRTNVTDINYGTALRTARRRREMEAQFLLVQYEQVNGRPARMMAEVRAWVRRARADGSLLPATDVNIGRYQAAGLLPPC